MKYRVDHCSKVEYSVPCCTNYKVVQCIAVKYSIVHDSAIQCIINDNTTKCISYCCHSFVYGAILNNIVPSARAIRRINSFSIALLGKQILGVPLGSALGNSHGLHPRELPWTQAILQSRSRLESLYRYSTVQCNKALSLIE